MSAMQPFAVRDCALVAIATGRRAQSLRELRDALLAVPQECVYYHFWGRMLRPRYDDTEFHNDFANWARNALHDDVLSERLAVIDPADFADLDALRSELVDVLDERLDETDISFASRERQFHFRRSQTVVFDTTVRLRDPAALAEAIPRMSLGSIYYHVIDARRREPLMKTDDLRAWLAQFGDSCEPLVRRLAGLDPYFSNLAQLRAELAGAFADLLPGRAAR
jgi:hypothetical protein